MLDTRQLNLLNERVRFEQGVTALPFDHPVQVTLAPDGKSVQFTHRGRAFQAKVERPLIHQLGSRVWGSLEYPEVADRWKRLSANQPSQLQQELAAIFQRHNLVARYYRDKTGVERIYGFVSPSFVDVNPLDFRQQFIEHIRHTTALSPKSEGLIGFANGDVMELFDFHSTGFQTEYQYGLLYARNSGYDAYKVHWGRVIIVCENGLNYWEGSIMRWKHTRKVAMGDFIDATIKEGVGNQKWLEQRIHSPRATRLQQDGIGELMARLSLAVATKERIHNQIRIEAKAVGETEWALTQALTWLGSHERHISPWSKRQLTALGTNVLENSLEKVLAEETRPYKDGLYGVLLPKSLNYTA